MNAEQRRLVQEVREIVLKNYTLWQRLSELGAIPSGKASAEEIAEFSRLHQQTQNLTPVGALPKMLQIIDAQQAEHEQLKQRLDQEWDALYSVLPDPERAQVSAKGAVILVREHVKAQQAVIDAAEATAKVENRSQEVAALNALHDALDKLKKE